MKRDMDLIRKLFFQLEGEQQVDLAEYDEDKIGYHRHLLIEAGLAHGNSMHAVGQTYPHGLCTRLTWEGYEFIDSVRDDTLWKKT